MTLQWQTARFYLTSILRIDRLGLALPQPKVDVRLLSDHIQRDIGLVDTPTDRRRDPSTYR